MMNTRNKAEKPASAPPKAAPGGQAHFGFRAVEEADRQGLVNKVFAKVASRYDQMNDLMSGGMHRLWKDALVDWLAPPRSRAFEVIDVAGGTGDVAMRIAQAAPKAQVSVCDINPAMIAEGARRARMAGLQDALSFSVGNAECLPFPNKRFDAYTIAFGIRNVTNIDTALADAYRVLKPGGRFLCLEFSQVQIPGLDALYEAYSQTAIPALGKAVTGDGAPYRYLVESIARFPNQYSFSTMIRDAGFARVKHRDLAGGIVAIHSGWRL